jgi:hypothetical protein
MKKEGFEGRFTPLTTGKNYDDRWIIDGIPAPGASIFTKRTSLVVTPIKLAPGDVFNRHF